MILNRDFELKEDVIHDHENKLFSNVMILSNYPIFFILLFEQYYQVLCCVKIQEKV